MKKKNFVSVKVRFVNVCDFCFKLSGKNDLKRFIILDHRIRRYNEIVKVNIVYKYRLAHSRCILDAH